MKLLAVQKLSRTTGEAQDTAVHEALQDSNLTDRVVFVLFDTTSSNSGNKAGACVLLEHKLNKPIFSLAFTNLKVFKTVIERISSCPQIKLFPRLATAIPLSNAFESGVTDNQLVT